MTILSIRTVGDPVLRSECEPITVFDRELAKLIDDMLDTMYDVEGVGLAGPQIGISKQIFTFGGIDGREGYIINPVLETGTEPQEGGEGCLSVPGMKSDTPRMNWARVRGVDKMGKPLVLEGEGLFDAYAPTRKPIIFTANSLSTALLAKIVNGLCAPSEP